VFSGIVRERAQVLQLPPRLVLQTSVEVGVGESVAVDGVCLTVAHAADGRLEFDVVPETTARTKPFGRESNVEPAVRVGDSLGGHFVQGHVDGVGRVRGVEAEGEGRRAWIDVPADILRYVAVKGSVAVDGVSLTVAEVDGTGFAVALVPHTLAVTTLGARRTGDEVNVEPDVLAKYVEQAVARLRGTIS